MTSILIRCDASLSMGSGHVIRCRTLARELQRQGAEVTFLCRRQSGDLIGLLEQEFLVVSLPELSLAICEDFSGRELYEAWLGCSQSQDAADCLQALGSAGVSHTDWFVVDHYGLDACWESLMLEGHASNAVPKLLVIDDLADRQHQADLLLDQNFFGDLTEHRYEGLLPQQCHQLLGPDYALMGPEYAQLHLMVPKRTELHRLLVFFGGVDPDNLTCRTLEALRDPAFSDLVVDVVLGRQSPHRHDVETMIDGMANTTLHGPLPSLAGLIVRADLAIGAGGSTVWERACLGLPSICIPSAENQLRVSNALAKYDYISLFKSHSQYFKQNLDELIRAFRSHDFLSHASQHCSSLTAGHGAALCTKMLLDNVAVPPSLAL